MSIEAMKKLLLWLVGWKDYPVMLNESYDNYGAHDELIERYNELAERYRALRILKMPPAQCDGPWQTRYAEAELEYERETKQLREDNHRLVLENYKLKRELNAFRSLAQAVERSRIQEEKSNG